MPCELTWQEYFHTPCSKLDSKLHLGLQLVLVSQLDGKYNVRKLLPGDLLLCYMVVWCANFVTWSMARMKVTDWLMVPEGSDAKFLNLCVFWDDILLPYGGLNIIYLWPKIIGYSWDQPSDGLVWELSFS